MKTSRLGIQTTAGLAELAILEAYDTIPFVETLRLRVEKQGRGGKTVTVVEGFTRERRLMERLASELKRALATGGTFAGGAISLQGDVRERLRVELARRGFAVKG